MASDDYGEDLISDFAQYYRIYDLKRYDTEYIAVLAAHLPERSRVKLAMSKQKYPTETLLLSAMLDSLNILVWQRTKSGSKGRNKPQSVTDRLLHADKYKSENEKVMAFESGEEFTRAFNRIVGANT